MSTFSKLNYNSLNYNIFRPHYPPSFYKILATYALKGSNKQMLKNSIDLGCATGITTYPLLMMSENVTGLDLSSNMIRTATSLIEQRCNEFGISDYSRIKFVSGSAEDFLAHEKAEGSYELITAAQCLHWFGDFDLFFRSSARLLKSGGTLAYWYYLDPIIVDYTDSTASNKKQKLEMASQIYQKYVYDDPKLLGPHWEQPGRNILKYRYKEINDKIPTDLYEDIVINSYEPDLAGSEESDSSDILDLKKDSIGLEDLGNYLRTYSSFQNYKDATGKQEELVEAFMKELETELGWSRESTKIDLIWNTGYVFLTKK